MTKTTTARAPATVANLIVGFDTLSLAINNLFDEVEIADSEQEGWSITEIINGDDIPLDPEKNVCTIAMEAMRKVLGDHQGYNVRIKKGYRAGSGLGSSAASAVAALWAYNAHLNFPLSKRNIIPFAMESEAYVSGKAIADNVSASALGGIVLVRSDTDHDFINLPVPDLHVGCVLPDIQIITKGAREILPDQILLSECVRQGANLAGFISSLYSSDWDLMRRSMHDILIEQHRAPYISHYFKAKEIALSNNAICFGIGGSGPAVFYFTEEERNGQLIGEKIKNMWADHQMNANYYVGKINTDGAQVVT